MKVLQQYRIPFTGLKLGKHTFDFDVDDRFFDAYEHSIVKKGRLKISVALEKQETLMIAWTHISGKVTLTCDVCLNEFEADTQVDERLIFKYTADGELADTSEEIVVLPKNSVEIDMAEPIYEYINLAVPLYKRCSEQGNRTCDENMLKFLSNFSVQGHDGEENQTDPRWDALKRIYKQ